MRAVADSDDRAVARSAISAVMDEIDPLVLGPVEAGVTGLSAPLPAPGHAMPGGWPLRSRRCLAEVPGGDGREAGLGGFMITCNYRYFHPISGT
jgi:hypothetical protein